MLLLNPKKSWLKRVDKAERGEQKFFYPAAAAIYSDCTDQLSACDRR